MLILNEEKYAREIYDCKNTDVKSVLLKVGYLTRYFLHSLHQTDKENYQSVVEWMQKYHNNFDESYYSNLISDAIKRAYKQPFYHIDSIKITQSELDFISSVDNLRAEKVLFVLLCMAKQQSTSNGFTNGLVKYSITELCKMARISVPAEDREYILYDIVQRGLLGYPKKNNTRCLIVNFINNDDNVVLELNEVDCQELAYAYLNWKNKGNGYGRCEFCGRFMRLQKKNPKRFCEYCADVVGNVPDNMKVISCIDCGLPVHVSALNTKTRRCDECQDKKDKELKSLRNARYYESHKN